MAITVPIVADFDNSGVSRAQAGFSDLSRQIGKAFSEVRKAAKDSLGDLEAGLEDSRTAGQKLAAQLSQASSKISAEMAKARETADTLAAALGPEMAAELGRNGIDRLVRDLQRAGLTMDDINQSADELAAALRQVDDVPMQHVEQGLTRVANEADRSRSVMANFAGNAVQELPGMANAFGPVNMALGQFVEYAAEGNISLAGLAKTIGPIAAVTAGISLLNMALSNMKKIDAWNDERVKNFNEGIKDGLSDVEAVRKALEEVGKVEVLTQRDAWGVFGSSAKDVTKELARMGLSMGDIVTRAKLIASGNGFAIAGIGELGKAAGLSTNEIMRVIGALGQMGSQLQQAQQDTYAQGVVFGFTDEQARSFTQGIIGVSYGMDATSASAEVLAQKMQTINPGTAAGLDALFGNVATNAGNAADNSNAFADSLLAVQAAYDSIMADINADELKVRLDDAFTRVKESGQEAFDAAKNGAKDAAEKARIYQEDLRNLRRVAAEYGVEVENLPPEQLTRIDLLLEQGRVDEVEAILDELARKRVVEYALAMAGLPGMASGGPVKGGTPYIVGEQGPELFIPAGSGRIVPNGQLPALASSGRPAASGNTTYVTVQGAIDPVATAYQIRRILNDDQARQAATSLVGV